MTHRYADPEQSIIRREGDGACIPADPHNADFAALAGAEIAPFQRWADLEAAQASLIAAVDARAAALRRAVAGTDDATKLAIYREKYETATRALAGDAAALAMLAPEALARGESPTELAALVKALGDAWIAAGLAIDAVYQGHKGAIAALETLDAANDYDLSAGWPALTG